MRWDDRPDDFHLELLARVHHPSESAEDVCQERPVAFIDTEAFLDCPSTEVGIRCNPKRRVIFTPRSNDALNESELINALHNSQPFLLPFAELDITVVNRFK